MAKAKKAKSGATKAKVRKQVETKKSNGGGAADAYKHYQEAVQRPDVGVQEQFTAKKAPKTYRYDSSLDPALSWDGSQYSRRSLFGPT